MAGVSSEEPGELGDECTLEAKEIVKNLQKGIPPKRIVNILVLGMPGVGKSSLINSCVMALNPKGYENVAPYGDFGPFGGGGETRITHSVHRYPVEDHILKKEDEPLVCKPVFWDCPGLMDDNDDNMKLILEYLLTGRIPEGKDPMKLRKYSLLKLKWKYQRSINEFYRINILCFVHAAGAKVPENLLRAVAAATMNNKREVPVMLVVTKMDKMDDKKSTDPDLKKKFIDIDLPSLQKTLGIIGTNEVLFLLTLNCNDVTPVPLVMKERTVLSFPRSAELDKDICKLWQTMLKPVYVMRDDINWPISFGKKQNVSK